MEARLSWAQTAALNQTKPICLSCGAEIAPILPRVCRCADCRGNRRRSTSEEQH